MFHIFIFKKKLISYFKIFKFYLLSFLLREIFYYWTYFYSIIMYFILKLLYTTFYFFPTFQRCIIINHESMLLIVWNFMKVIYLLSFRVIKLTKINCVKGFKCEITNKLIHWNITIRVIKYSQPIVLLNFLFMLLRWNNLIIFILKKNCVLLFLVSFTRFIFRNYIIQCFLINFLNKLFKFFLRKFIIIILFLLKFFQFPLYYLN